MTEDTHNTDLFHNVSTLQMALRTILSQVREAPEAMINSISTTITATIKAAPMRLNSNKATIKDISNSNHQEDEAHLLHKIHLVAVIHHSSRSNMETTHHEEHREDMPREAEIQEVKDQGEDDHRIPMHKGHSKEELHQGVTAAEVMVHRP